MVLVYARQPFILATVTEALREQGVVSRVVVPESPDDDLVDRAWEARPSHIIAISSLPALGASARGSEDDALLAEALSACRSPARSTLIWVTPQDGDSEALRAIRRSGVPYAIVRAGQLVRPSDLRPEPVPGEEILVPNDLPVPEAGLTSLASLASAIARATVDDDLVGGDLDAASRGEDAWTRVVESHGSRARTVGRGRARWSRLWGGRVLRLVRGHDADGEPSSSTAHVETRATA